MNRYLCFVLAIVLLAVMGFLFVSASAQAEKVTVCHAAGQEGTTQFVTLEVPPNEGGFPQGHFTEDGTALAGHEDDYLGACEEEPTEAPTVTEVPDATNTPVVVPSPSATDPGDGETPSPTPTQEETGTADPVPTRPLRRPTCEPIDPNSTCSGGKG